MPSEGIIRFEGRDISGLGRQSMRPLRRHMQIVLQDPFGSLSPRMTAGEIVTEDSWCTSPSSPRASATGAPPRR